MEMFANIGIFLAILLLGICLAKITKRLKPNLSDSFERAAIGFPAALTWMVGFANGHSVISQLNCYEEYTQIDEQSYLDDFGNEVSYLEVQFSCGQALVASVFVEAIAGFAIFTIPGGAKDLLGIG